MATAIFPAAGQSRRMRSTTNKNFLELAGQPILIHTLLKFSKSDKIDNLIIAAASDEVVIIEEMLSVCTPIQRDRIRKFYLEGMPIPEIANGRSIKAVYKSIRAGLIKIQKIYHVKVEK